MRFSMLQRHLAEGTFLFYKIIKWLVLASIIGLLAGASTTVFLKVLDWGIRNTAQYPYYFLLLPAALLLSTLLVMYLAPEAEGHGTEKVIEAVHKRSGKIDAAVIPVKILATVVTIAGGGSAGKEGPSAQIGAGVASLFADIFRFNDAERRILVICGISAGFASVFGTPIAGAIFGVEVLFAGRLLYDVLLPSLIAGIISFQVTSHFGITYFRHPIGFVPVFSRTVFLEVVLAGIFFGICAFILVEILSYSSRYAKSLKLSKPAKSLVGGIALIGLALLFSRQYLGLGLESIRASLEGSSLPWYAFLAKSVFTAITLSFGGSGGVITPVLFVGSTSGTLFAGLLHLDSGTFAALGLVSVLAGATNTPIAASIMAIELFGAPIAPYAAIACVISYFMTGHRSVYPSQVFEIRKALFIDFETGKEIREIQKEITLSEKPVTTIVRRLIGRFRKK